MEKHSTGRHSTKRKRKKQSSIEKKKNKRDKRETSTATHHKDSSSSSSVSRHKNLMQLAKLVQAGNLQIPPGLQHYFEDSSVLIDQLFTILTPQDIQGMLPDILKDLKVRKIKELCLKELQKLSEEELTSILSDKLQESPKTPPTPDERRSSTPPIRISDVSDEETIPPAAAHTLTDPPTPDEIAPPIHSAHKSHDSPTGTSLTSNESKSHDQEKNSRKDPSSTEQSKKPRKSPENSGALFRVGTDSDDNIELMAGSGVTSSDSCSSDSEREESDGGWVRDITEHQRLVEMKLRKRLLENQLKRIDSQSSCASGNEREETGQTDPVDQSDESISGSEDLLEIRLRQKALQSLLARKSSQ